MAKEYMTKDDERRAKIALLILTYMQESLKNIFDLLDGTHVEMPGPEATINSALEWADHHLKEASRRLRRGMGLEEEKKTE